MSKPCGTSENNIEDNDLVTSAIYIYMLFLLKSLRMILCDVIDACSAL